MNESVIPLFSEDSLYFFLQNHLQDMLSEINSLNENSLLNTGIDDWCDYFEQKFKLAVPQLLEKEIEADYSETQQQVNDYGRNISVPATEISFFVPFEGKAELFRYEPSTSETSKPYAFIIQGELILKYQRTDHNAKAVESVFKRDLAQIQRHLDWITQDISSFNDSVRLKAKERIETRRQKFLKDRGLVATFGFPLRRRENAPKTYVVPTVRRKVPISRPSTSAAPYVPEPTVEMQEYEHILSVIFNMVMVMERSPQAFRGMGEEDIRQHFLVQLNGQYEGQATGETFNFNGKTDILIRVDGKNIFIAECKFWGGEEKLKETLEQLLGYTSWRDTKTALLIFNRNKDFSAVVQKIPEVIKAHTSFKRVLPYNCETGFRCVLHHPDDVNREIILTTLAFNVPQ
ncbi:hypothetical protein WA1_42225 [Scytonema hofmannii PCC 7110]|uniref:Uncharacterized protein n=1 Tax=Scytonema hofmannii PCC 7110 TaxID=128403 RepID=A0A139WV72_9CYAN|nr:hypothetical protein [Scytonema hofmannii]KYC36340.1 hypothetical protein WA1_42225 [Scytonema hofmannii PCC 7110]